MSSLRILSGKGDTVVAEWDETKLDTPEAKAAIAEAEKIIKSSIAGGSSLFSMPVGAPAQRVTKFDPSVEGEYAILPRLVGG